MMMKAPVLLALIALATLASRAFANIAPAPAAGSANTAPANQPSGGTLLQFDFNDAGSWPQKPVAGVGTIDTAGGKEGSGGLLLVVEAAAAKGAWMAALGSGPLAVRNTETNLGKLTWSFSLSASEARPVKVCIESFDAQQRRTGGLETQIYPAAPDFYQRYAVDLSSMVAVGGGAFRPTDPFVSFTYTLEGAAGWAAATRHELRLDNVHYAKPAFYVSPQGQDANDGRSETSSFATPPAALDAAHPGDIILLMDGTYNGGLKPTAAFTRPGTPAAWIVLKNYPGQKPLVTGNAWNIVSFAFGSKQKPDQDHELAYLEVRGLHVRGESDLIEKKFPETIGKSDSRSNSNGIAVDGRYMSRVPHHIRIADNLVEYCPGQGIGALEADWTTFENNTSRYNSWHTIYGTSGISTLGASNFDAADNVYKTLIRNNVSHRNETFQPWATVKKISDGNGIIIDVNQDTSDRPKGSYLGRTLVANNLSYDNGGSGIHCVRANRVDIINNTVYLNSASKSLQYAQIFTHTSSDVRIFNNILVAPVADIAAGEKPEPVNKLNGKNINVVFSNNLYFGGNIPPTLGEGDKIADPLFVNASTDPAKADFHMQKRSPTVRAGRWEPFSPLLDLDGKSRALDSAPSLGAYRE